MSENAWIYCLLALALGVGVSRREQQDGTLHFLDGLPLSRSWVFWTKIAATTLVVAITPVLETLYVVWSHQLVAESLQEEVHPQLVALCFALRWAVLFVCVGVGAVAGLMRSLAWASLAAVSSLLLLTEQRAPAFGCLRPTALLEPHLVGLRWEVPPQVVAAQTAVLSISLAVAWIGFLGSSRPRTRELHPWISTGLQAIGGLIVVGGGVFLLVELADAGRADKPSTERVAGQYSVEVASRFAAALETRWFRFSYREERAQVVRDLAAEADALAEQVAAIVNLPIGGQVEVDTSGSMDNTSGTAFADSVRMEMDDNPRSVLAHELTHVITHRAVGEAGAERWDEATLLNEGLAEWVERHISGEEPADRVLAVLAARRELDLVALMDMETFARLHDQNLKYPLGAALVDALVDLGGPEAPSRVVAAFARPDLPADLEGRELYATVFQLAGVDLGRVLDEVDRKAPAAAPEAWVESLSRPEVTLFAERGRYALRVTTPRPLPEGCSLVVRTRPGPESPLKLYRNIAVSDDAPQWRDQSELRGEQVCFQPGVRLLGGQVLYERWSCVPISAAAAWEAGSAVFGE